MRIALSCIVFLTACSGDANDLGNPLLLPLSGLTTLAENTVYNERLRRVEVLVKSNHPALIDQINAGAGSILIAAFDTAGVPATDRPTRIIGCSAVGKHESGRKRCGEKGSAKHGASILTACCASI